MPSLFLGRKPKVLENDEKKLTGSVLHRVRGPHKGNPNAHELGYQGIHQWICIPTMMIYCGGEVLTNAYIMDMV